MLRPPSAPLANVCGNGARIHNLFTVQVYPCLAVLAGLPLSSPDLGLLPYSTFLRSVPHSTKHSRALAWPVEFVSGDGSDLG
jgi:hypothetical protein